MTGTNAARSDSSNKVVPVLRGVCKRTWMIRYATSMVDDTMAIRPCLNVWHSKTATLNRIYGRLLANPKFESVTRMTLFIPASIIANKNRGKQNRNMLDVTKEDAIYLVSLTILMIL